jgi:hypothetical protein
MAPNPDQHAGTLDALHGALRSAAGAVHSAATAVSQRSAEPHPDVQALLQHLAANGAGAGPGAPPPDPGTSVGAPGPDDPGTSDEQVIWQAFPSTDPSVIDHLAQTSGPEGMIPALLRLLAADEQKLHDQQMQVVSAALAQASAPAGEPMPAAAEPSPEVGGETSGY